MRKEKRLEIRLSSEDILLLDQISESKKISRSEMIRSLIRAYARYQCDSLQGGATTTPPLGDQ